MPSSLPPSSPPSSSSHLLESKLDDFFNYNIRPSSLPMLSSDDEIRREDGNKLDITESDEVDLSDPFGFFELEKRLKAQRAGASSRKATRYRFDVHKPLQAKQLSKGKFGRMSELEGASSPRTSSLLSTPSPSKPPTNKTQAKPSLPGENAYLVIPKTSGGGRGTKSRVDDGLGIPNSLVKVVKPKRPIRRAVVVRSQSRAPDSGDDTEQNAPRKGRAPTLRNARKRGTPQKGVKKKEVLDCDTEELGKREQERHARVEYFKRLQDYRLEKENVYVI